MILIKIGGGKNINLQAIVDDLQHIEDDFFIIHGANAIRDDLADQLGISKEVIISESGYSSVKSTDELLDVMLMSYSGLRNKRLVELLQKNNINAVGLTGADGRLIQGKRNRGIRTRKGDKRIIVRDNSGKPKEVNTELLHLLMNYEYTPVITVPIIDENGKLINSENDDIVALLSQSMNISKVIMLIEERGLLKNYQDPSTFIDSMNHVELEKWIKTTEGRIQRKLYAISNILRPNGPSVIISDGRSDLPIRNALQGKGSTFSW